MGRDKSVKVEDIDHLGIVAGVIQELGIIEMIDSRITPDEREEKPQEKPYQV